MAEEKTIPHKLILDCRKALAITGVAEVISFDENVVVLKTHMGQLTVHGSQLQLKSLTLDGGQVAVEGQICALVYEEPRKSGTWRRSGR